MIPALLAVLLATPILLQQWWREQDERPGLYEH